MDLVFLRRAFGLSVLALLLTAANAPAEPPSPQQAQAEAVLARVRDLGRRLKTFSATVTLTEETFDAKGQLTARRSFHAEVLFRRPAHWQYVLRTDGKTSTHQLCDGKDLYSFSPDGAVRRFQLTTPPVWPRVHRSLALLYDPDQPLVEARQLPQLRYLGKLEHDRKSCDVIQVRSESSFELQGLLFLADGGVPVKWVATYFLKDGGCRTITDELTRYALDPELPPERFAFKLPEGTKLIDGDAERETRRAQTEHRKKEQDDSLLKVGQKAPAFEVPDTDGNRLTLDGLLQGKKALVLHLWCFS